MRAVYARDPGQADATCRERYAYNPAGMNGKPSSAPLDSPLFGQIDVAGDGTFERSFYLIQNTLGDVIKIVEGVGAGGQHEELRYTLYGEPYIVNWLADINQDGAVDGEDLISFFALWDVGAFGSDTNGDGGVDGDDVIQFLAWWDNGEGAGRTTEDNRFGFRGYVWDDHLKLYHVRHRVYDPVPGPAGLRWLQRDPAFFVDGLNLYAYCGGDPVNGVDPLGLVRDDYFEPRSKAPPAKIELSPYANPAVAAAWDTVHQAAEGAAAVVEANLDADREQLQLEGFVGAAEALYNQVAHGGNPSDMRLQQEMMNLSAKLALQQMRKDGSSAEAMERDRQRITQLDAECEHQQIVHDAEFEMAMQILQAMGFVAGEAAALSRGAVGGTNAASPMFQSGASRGSTRATSQLMEKAQSHGRTITVLEEGSDALAIMDKKGVNASVWDSGSGLTNIELRPDPRKIELLEEFLHRTQQTSGLLDRIGVPAAEVHVKEFMIRHRRMLGLADEDVTALQRLLGR